jgi:hypothetical protein
VVNIQNQTRKKNKMPMLVAKVFLVDTDSADEAYELTKPASDKVETYSVGRVSPFDPATTATNSKAAGLQSGTPGVAMIGGVPVAATMVEQVGKIQPNKPVPVSNG